MFNKLREHLRAMLRVTSAGSGRSVSTIEQIRIAVIVILYDFLILLGRIAGRTGS